MININKLIRCSNAALHQIDEVGASCNDLCTRLIDNLQNALLGCRADVLKLFHTVCPPSFTSCMPFTMLGYAPQRQILPLIYSLISDSEFACPSRIQATADMI